MPNDCPRCNTPGDDPQIHFVVEKRMVEPSPVRWFRGLGKDQVLQQQRTMYCRQCLNRWTDWADVPVVDESQDVADKLREDKGEV